MCVFPRKSYSRADGGGGAELHLTPPLQGVKQQGFLGVLSLHYAFPVCSPYG